MRLVLVLALTSLVVTLAPARADALVVDRINGTVRNHMGDVRVCYVHALVDRPSLEGRITVSFVVGPDGSVSSARTTEDSVGDLRMTECVLTAVRSWTFPAVDPSSGLQSAQYPFVFTR